MSRKSNTPSPKSDQNSTNNSSNTPTAKAENDVTCDINNINYYFGLKHIARENNCEPLGQGVPGLIIIIVIVIIIAVLAGLKYRGTI